MATVPVSRPRDLAQTQQKIRHPLERLRGYIYAYIGLEAALLAVLFLAVWFWAGLLLDYGIFRLTGFDHVETFHPSVRWVVLVLCVGGLLFLLTRSLLRLSRELSDQA